jgi:hypothetical protein
MKHKRNLTLFLLIAIAITSLGYILDNDMPYQKWTMTMVEFSGTTLLLFALQCAPYGIVVAHKKYSNKKD